MIKNLLRWCRVSLAGADSADYPIQQVDYLGKTGDAVVWFPYGFHANIPVDELALMLSLQGNPEARVALPGSPTSRPKPLVAGEVVVYHPPSGSKIHFKANGDVDVEVKNDLNVTVLGDLVASITGAATVTAGGAAVVTAASVAIDSTTGDVDITSGAAGANDSSVDSAEHTITGDLNHDGTNVGFHGATPVAISPAYSPTFSTDRTFDASTTTELELGNVLGTLITDLQAKGLIG